MRFIYDIGIQLLVLGMKVGALFNQKIKKGVGGRAESCKIVVEKFSSTDRVLWMHAASLGEYEQGLPVLQKLKEKFPDLKVLITFFSPSGYEHIIKKEPQADAICYLPFDTPSKIKTFTRLFKTEVFFTVKYDFWFHLLEELKMQNAKTYVISAHFYPKQVYFKPWGKWFGKQLKKNVDWFFHQTEDSLNLAQNIGLLNGSVSGDTRFDRVKQNLKRDNRVEFLKEFTAAHTTLVLGSSWEAEERLAKILTEKQPECKLIIAPHDLKRVKALTDLFPHALLYSKAKYQTSLAEYHVLIIDCIGLLSKAYFYGDLAVVGGGFHRHGLHNILEAAVFGIPVFFGNHYKKNPEADGLISAKGGKAFSDEFYAAKYIGEVLKNKDILQAMGENAQNFIFRQPNAAQSILEKVAQDFQN